VLDECNRAEDKVPQEAVEGPVHEHLPSVQLAGIKHLLERGGEYLVMVVVVVCLCVWWWWCVTHTSVCRVHVSRSAC
jgi:hypothetical protein